LQCAEEYSSRRQEKEELSPLLPPQEHPLRVCSASPALLSQLHSNLADFLKTGEDINQPWIKYWAFS